MAKTKRNLVYFINKENKTDFHLVSFISRPTLGGWVAGWLAVWISRKLMPSLAYLIG